VHGLVAGEDSFCEAFENLLLRIDFTRSGVMAGLKNFAMPIQAVRLDDSANGPMICPLNSKSKRNYSQSRQSPEAQFRSIFKKIDRRGSKTVDFR
jgi:hypothetical protein